ARRLYRSERSLMRTGAHRRKGELAGWQMLICRMEPGEWYARRDVETLMPEYARGSIGGWLSQLMPRRGMIDRAANPEIVDPAPQRGEPIYLYRMTATAAEMRVGWLRELGGGESAQGSAAAVLGELW